jgi:hypothetical protein
MSMGLILSIAQNLLPADWTTILKITRLDDETYGQLVDDVQADEKRVLDLVPVQGTFRTLVGA